MEALIKKDAVVGISIEELPIPQPAKNEVLIRILRASLSGTDLTLYQCETGVR
jgi:NADPH:quinone reductase-like Zn-dependent oxidoreductase